MDKQKKYEKDLAKFNKKWLVWEVFNFNETILDFLIPRLKAFVEKVEDEIDKYYEYDTTALEAIKDVIIPKLEVYQNNYMAEYDEDLFSGLKLAFTKLGEIFPDLWY